MTAQVRDAYRKNIKVRRGEGRVNNIIYDVYEVGGEGVELGISHR